MDHFEGVVLEYLRADRGLFVNSQFCIQLNPGDNPDSSGPHWYCDAVAVSLREETAYLCEITYASRTRALLQHLSAWNAHWDALKGALTRDGGVPIDWKVRPWLFVPEREVEQLRRAASGFEHLPAPRISPLEATVLPWLYRSWNRTPSED